MEQGVHSPSQASARETAKITERGSPDTSEQKDVVRIQALGEDGKLQLCVWHTPSEHAHEGKS